MKLALRNGRDILPLEESFNRIFDDFFSPSLMSLYRKDLDLIPPVELSEEDNSYIVKAQLPGINKEDLDIQIHEDSVVISGESRCECEQKDKNIHKSEFRYGKFSRTIQLPDRIDNKNAKADYDNGVLSLTLPKIAGNNDKVIRLKL